MLTADQPSIEPAAGRVPHVLAITSGKGGVGKSSIAVNLGIALSRAGQRVCILDADTGLANVNILLGLTPRLGLEHVIFGGKSIEDILLEGPHGLTVIPGANGISECVNLLPRQQQRLMSELAKIEADFDYLLLDTAAGISDTTLDCVCSAQQVLLVITPEPTSLTDAFSMVKLLQRRRPVVLQVVVNMCASPREAREIYARFNAAVQRYIGTQTHFLGFLQRDESLRVAVTLQRPVAMLPESDPSCRNFVRLAESLDTVLRAQPPAEGFTAFWEHRVQETQDEEPSLDPEPREESAAAITVADIPEHLESRLLALLNVPEASPDDFAEIVRSLHEAYLHRFGRSAIDPVTLVRMLAEHGPADTVPWQVLADEIARHAPSPEPVTPMPAVAPAIQQPAIQQYDARRFGPQETLVEILRQRNGWNCSTLTLIEALAEQ